MGIVSRLAALRALRDAGVAVGTGDVAPGPLRAPAPPRRVPDVADPVVFGWPRPLPLAAGSPLGHVSCVPCGVEWRGGPACWHCGQPATY